MDQIETDYDRFTALIDANSLTGALFLLVVFLLFGLLLSLILRRAMRLMIARDKDGRLDRLGAAFLSEFAQVFLWVFVAMLYAHTIPALDRFGTALLASASIASVVIGLAAQSTLANLIAGLSLVLYKPFRLGDRLEVAVPGGVETGTVETVSLGYTVLQTYDNRRVVLSNSTIANAVMINHTKTSPALWPSSRSRSAMVPTLTQGARTIVVELAARHPQVQAVSACPVVLLNAASVDFSLMAWCKDAVTAKLVTFDLTEAIKKAFDENGIEIPYPYQNVILKECPTGGAAATRKNPPPIDPEKAE